MKKYNSGLLPVSGNNPRILILGSFPSVISLKNNEYYGNKNNAFWKIMEKILGIDRNLPYAERINLLTENGIALWDVVSACNRNESSDSSINDVILNDIPSFLRKHDSIVTVILNGKSGAGKLFQKNYPDFSLKFPCVSLIILPSTSSANAIHTIEEKIKHWSAIKIILATQD